MQGASKLARKIASNAPLAVRSAKQVFDDIVHRSLATGLAKSREPRSALNATSDYREGLLAFQEKRRPVFRGE